MKVLLAAVNAKYIHSNLAIYCLKEYAENQLQGKVLSSRQGLFSKQNSSSEQNLSSGQGSSSKKKSSSESTFSNKPLHEESFLHGESSLYKEPSLYEESFLYKNASLYKESSSFRESNKIEIELAEYTINQQTDEILRDIYKRKPDILAFSCYIWNIAVIKEIIREYKKVDKAVKLWAGGPEVSYNPKESMEELVQLDGIIVGEGEETFAELLNYYFENQSDISTIKGIVFRDRKGKLIQNLKRPPLDFTSLPFPYKHSNSLAEFEHKIIYYESSRGCPFSCSYCLSSIDKRVRFRELHLVKQELSLFLKKKVAQVKFVDRTFNCNKTHALEIWKFIKEQDNGITNFHFEIAADLMDQEELEVLSSMRPGLVQLEIGVQSTNPDTIKAIHRTMDLDKVKEVTKQIRAGRNIHQHLDLIAGLPYEDYSSFRQSFCEVYKMKPDQLQLGFLKVLKGSSLYKTAAQYGIVWQSKPPYEVLYTKWLSFDDVLRLKQIEEQVEVYYNTGQFTYSILFLEHFFKDSFSLYEALAKYYEIHEFEKINHSRIKRYEILNCFFKQLLEESVFNRDKIKTADNQVWTALFEEILLYDLYLREPLKTRPSFAPDREIYKMKLKQAAELKREKEKKKEPIHIEHVFYDSIESAETGSIVEKEGFLLFDYRKRDPLSYNAVVDFVKL